MANIRSDPSLLELYESIKTDELLHTFLKEHHLIADPRTLGYTSGRAPKPFIGYCNAVPFNKNKPNCTGLITESAHHGTAAFDPNATGVMTIFNGIDSLQRPNRKICPRDVLYIIFAIAHEIPPSKLSILTGTKLAKDTLINWGVYLRQIAQAEMSQQPKMGGVGETIEIDETYLQGRRKYNRGRYLAGNIARFCGNRRNNFHGNTNGPWLFEMMCRRTKEVQTVWVPDRSAATLIPIIKKHVAVGSLIISDEWRAYRSLPNHGFLHQTVNHSTNFVNPTTNASTQLIERYWQKIKLLLLKIGPGVYQMTIESHLAKFWWLSVNGRSVCKDPFLRYIDLIAKHLSL